MSHLIAFAAVALLLVAVPGPDFAVVTRNAITSRRFGMWTALGIAGGLCFHAVLAGLGLSAILLTSSVAFTIVKTVGALYLGFLGLQALLAAVRKRKPEASVVEGVGTKKKLLQASKASTPSAAFRQGLLTNLLNPKAVLVFISLLPQFVPDGGSRTEWTAALATELVFIAVSWFMLVAVLVTFFKSQLAKPKVERSIEGVTGVSFLGFGARLILERR